MLKITCTTGSSDEILLVAEGRLIGPWVWELKKAVTAAGFPQCCVTLDLASVGYVDEPGLALLQQLIKEGIAIRRKSIYIKQLLNN